MFEFKVQDYTTHIIGRYDKEADCYYVERGDGTRYKYESYRVEWAKPLTYAED